MDRNARNHARWLPGWALPSQAALRVALLLAAFAICTAPAARAWGSDVRVLAEADSVDRVALAADLEDGQRLYALLGRTAPAPGAQAGDEIAVSPDGGASWSLLARVPPAAEGRSALAMAAAGTSLCVVEACLGVPHRVLQARCFDERTGALLSTTPILENLDGAGDLSLCAGTHPALPAPVLFLAAVVDQGSGSNLFFARSGDGGLTWTDDVFFGVGDLGCVDVTFSQDITGHVLLTYILGDRAHFALNHFCGHSEYWGTVYGELGEAATDARPSVVVRSGVALVAWETPSGDVTYVYSLNGSYAWQPGGLLAAGPLRQLEPRLSISATGCFHLTYLDLGDARVHHRATWTPNVPESWSSPFMVSDGSVWAGSGMLDLHSPGPPLGGVAALFVEAGERTVAFDRQPPAATRAGRDRETPRAGSVLLRAPSPASPPIAFSVEVAPGALAGVEQLAIEILDVSGRLVRRMPLTRVRGGDVVVWDGRDHWQRPVCPGIYLARVRRAGSVDPEGGSGVRRILLVR